MKKKLSIVCIICVVSILFTGCTNPIDQLKSKIGKKDDASTEETTDSTGNYTADDWSIAGGPYSKGSVNTFDTIVTLPPEQAAAVSTTGILDETGALVDSLPTDVVGEHTVSLVAQMSDGTKVAADYTYTVEEGSIEALPDEIKNNLKEGTWILVNAPYLDESGETKQVSYNSSIISLEGALNISQTSTDEVKWVSYVLPKAAEETLAANGLSPLRTPMSVITMRGLINNDSTGMSADQNLTNMVDAYDELFKLSTEDTEYTFYDIDGTVYPLKKAVTTFNASEDDKRVECYYISNDTEYILFIPTTAGGLSTGAQSIDAQSSSLPGYDASKTYTKEELETMIKSAVTDSGKMFDLDANTRVEDNVKLLVFNAVLGDATPFAGGEVPADNENSDPDEVDGEAPSAHQLTYAEKYPSLYTWPKNPNGNIYRPWVYEILDQTTIASSIWLGSEGKYFYGAANSSDSTTPTTVNDSSNSSSTSGSETTGGDSASTSNYVVLGTGNSKLEFRTSANSGVVITDASQDGTKLQFTYKGNTYFMMTTNENEIAGQLNGDACLYSTEYFYEGKWSAEAQQSYSVGSYQITPYLILYKDESGSTQHKGAYLMAIKKGGAYYELFASSIDKSASIMDEILKTCLTN